MLDFVFGVNGLPPMSRKSNHSPMSNGLGMHHFPQRYHTRVLDTVHKLSLILPLQPTCSLDPLPSPYYLFRHSLTHLQRLLPAPQAPPHTSIPPSFTPTELQDLRDFQVYTVDAPHPRLDCTYSDGSYFPSTFQAGSAAVPPDSPAVAARLPGPPGNYAAELLGLLLGSVISANGAVIKSDNKGAVHVANTAGPVVRQAWLKRQ